jgi:phage baseplate assembly protein W
MANSKLNKKFVDLDLSFKINPFTKDLYLKTDEEAVKASVKHLILTKNFERPFQPEIGTQVSSLMFENFTPAVKIAMKRTIEETITKYEPRVRIIDVALVDRPNENDISITVVFALKNTDTPITVSTLLSRVR